jgi:3-hydroxyisobutyrate dehydrogenase-like beta-hydroxyacid dehydrogenase
MAETIGFVGLGQMGRQMAGRLLKAGISLRVWNRTRRNAEDLEGAGGNPRVSATATAAATVKVCDSPREVATGVEIVVSSLADDRAVHDVVRGNDGLLGGLGPGAIHVGTSTISYALAATLAEAHAARGSVFVASPVLGRPEAAEHGLLWLLTGGDATAIARCQPVFAAIARGQVHLGTQPQALLGKIVANFMIAGTIELLAEATALGAKGGIAPKDLVAMLGGTLFGSSIVTGYGARIAAGTYQPAGFRMALGLKDVELALSAGHELRAPLPVAGIVRDHIIEALARGYDAWDWSGLAAIVHQAAGLPTV